jgi:peptidyl-prolyl cis-trans isomerase C
MNRTPFPAPFRILVGAAALLALAACKPEKKPPTTSSAAQPLATSGNTLSDADKGKVVARVGDAVITLEDFERRLNQQTPFARNRYNTLERKREFLESLVRFEVLAIAAAEAGYDKDPDVVLAQKQAMVKVLMARDVRDLVKMEDITDADIETYYREHLSDYDKPEQVRASHILLTGPDAEKKAKALHAEIAGLADKKPRQAREIFADFAKKHSEDKVTRESGGDLQFFAKPGEARVDRPPLLGEVAPPVALAAFGVEKVGGIAPAPVKTSAGWHLVQKTGFRRPYKRELADVQTNIRNKLFRLRKSEAMQNYVKDLKEKSKIEVDEKALAEAKVEVKPGGGQVPPLGPGGLPPGLREKLMGGQGAGK